MQRITLELDSYTQYIRAVQVRLYRPAADTYLVRLIRFEPVQGKAIFL